MASQQVGHEEGSGTKVVSFCSPPVAFDRVITGIVEEISTINVEHFNILDTIVNTLARKKSNQRLY
jgi:mannitol/fructose-specific phosphotransferase system IIA component